MTVMIAGRQRCAAEGKWYMLAAGGGKARAAAPVSSHGHRDDEPF